MSDTFSFILEWLFFFLFLALPSTACLSRFLAKVGKNSSDGDAFKVWSVIFGVASIAISILSVMAIFWGCNQIKTEGVAYETNLNAQYVQDENVLSTYVTSFSEQLGVANLQSRQIRSIITQAVASQANLHDLIAPGSSPLFLAVSQAYPNVTLSQYNELIKFVQAGRQSFQENQANLAKQLTAYDNWQHTGFLFQPALVHLFGFPTSLLRVDVDGKTLTGAAAEAKMWKIVKDPATEAAFYSGRQTAITVTDK
jgi:hypothetical protein